MSTNEKKSSGMSEATNLIEELNAIFAIYTKELKDWREGNGKGKFLLDDGMFDVVIKLLNVSDKIKKLNAPVETTETSNEVPPKDKIVNIQDAFLKKA